MSADKSIHTVDTFVDKLSIASSPARRLKASQQPAPQSNERSPKGYLSARGIGLILSGAALVWAALRLFGGAW